MSSPSLPSLLYLDKLNTDIAKPDSQPQHAKNNVAPAPELEKGGAIEGMNASGGGNKADQAEPTVAGDKPAQ